MRRIKLLSISFGLVSLVIGESATSQAASGVFDPGVRAGVPGAGTPMPTLTPIESAYYNDGLNRFVEVDAVTGGVNNGLGPRYNSNQCSGCHSQPGIGGSSPPTNPSPALATLGGAKNTVPWFIAPKGPVREVRFKTFPDGTADGGVHNLYVITGRSDAPSCNIAQPNFLPAGNPMTGQGGNSNLAFRIPTPVFGAGLIEAIPDSTILANMNADANLKSQLGIKGHPNAHVGGVANRSGNDGTITRFGWKAQNKSLLLFAGEAYNVEMGVTNQLFPQERDETPGCVYNPTPEDTNNFTGSPDYAVLSDIEAFGNFMRMLAPPTPAPDTPTIVMGRAGFVTVGCAACHTPSMTTGPTAASVYPRVKLSASLSNQTANLYSDLLVHQMGANLADGVTQGSAAGNEFRTAPLWGVGQRVFFLHDGRTSNIVEAIEAHRGSGSEANAVINQFDQAPPQMQQAIVDFLRAL